MDVHDLARAVWPHLLKAAGIRPERFPFDPDKANSNAAYDVAATLLPLIESHTRAAVEAERAACEAVALGVSKQCETIGALRSSDTADKIANAIASRKAQP